MSDPFLDDVEEVPPADEGGLDSILHHLMDVILSLIHISEPTRRS